LPFGLQLIHLNRDAFSRSAQVCQRWTDRQGEHLALAKYSILVRVIGSFNLSRFGSANSIDPGGQKRWAGKEIERCITTSSARRTEER
jgi:hypothetical protein